MFFPIKDTCHFVAYTLLQNAMLATTESMESAHCVPETRSRLWWADATHCDDDAACDGVTKTPNPETHSLWYVSLHLLCISNREV